jgi:drug/metabolite transporter (DMT)-like permease
MSSFRVFYYVLLIMMTVAGSVAALFFKRAASFRRLHGLVTDFNFWIGGTLYIATALINIFVLHFLDYSIVLPFTSLTYFWTIFLSHWTLGESLNAKKICGAVCIVLGAVLLCIQGA